MVVDYKKEGKIAVFTINRPDAMNAISMEVRRALNEALIDFRDDPNLWVGIITGAGSRAFSAGADIKEMSSRDKVHRTWENPASLWRGIELWKPLIAAVNGLALGGGLEIALACDIRIAAETAIFGSPEVNIGIIPGWGATQRLPRMVPWCKAAEILLMGKPIDAQEAYRIGLVNKVVPPDQLMATAREWAEIICQRAPLAVNAAKEAMIRGSSVSLEEGLRIEMALSEYLQSTEDAKEGPRSFVEKRPPRYQAK